VCGKAVLKPVSEKCSVHTTTGLNETRDRFRSELL
jgi:hypothetical protein